MIIARGRVARARDSQSRNHRFKSCSDQLAVAMVFSIVPSSFSQFSASLVNSQLVCLQPVGISRLCSGSTWSPRRPVSIFRRQEKTYPVARPGDLVFEAQLRDFDFFCCIEVSKANWLNSECVNPSVKSNHRSLKFNTGLQ